MERSAFFWELTARPEANLLNSQCWPPGKAKKRETGLALVGPLFPGDGPFSQFVTQYSIYSILPRNKARTNSTLASSHWE